MGFFDSLGDRVKELFGLNRVISPLPDAPRQDSNKIRVNFTTPTPTPTATPTPRPMPTPTLIPQAPPNPYMPMIQKYFPPQEQNNASNVMFKESSFNPTLIHPNQDQYGSRDYGAYQFNDHWQGPNLAAHGLTIADMLDPETAIKFAAWLQSQQGWQPWASAGGLGLE